jgi:hypothetical protein
LTVRRPILLATMVHRRPSRTGFATAEDLDLAFAPQPSRIDERALIHVADFLRERALYTLHSEAGLRLALEAPFLYDAALDHASGLLSVPFERLPELDPGGASRPCFIFSLGRTGSTLLVRLLRAVGCDAASEPDWFTQLCRLDSRECHLIGPSMLAALVSAGVTSLASVLGPAPFIKLRSHCSARADLLAGALPAMRAVLMLRGRRGWALSRRLAFRETPETIANILLEGIAAFDLLSASGIPPLVLWYEDLLADPAAALRALLPGRPVDDAALLPVLREDSQADTKLARSVLASQTIDDAFMPAFDQAWHAVRDRAAVSVSSRALVEALER